MSKKIIMGMEGGGTFTRIAIADTYGNLLAYVKHNGSAHPRKDPAAKQNIRNAMHEALKIAGCRIEDIISLTAGMPGYDKESDLTWVRDLTDIEGLICPIQHVNDATVANIGAFVFKPGIIAISGTGSITYGITETERHIRNYDFYHYAATAARFLSFDCVHKIIAGETDDTDADLIADVCRHFGVSSVTALALLGADGFMEDRPQRDKHFGRLAPVLTQAAACGSNLAIQICKKAAADIVTSIKVVGACFESDIIPVVLIGSVVHSAVIHDSVKELLAKEGQGKRYHLTEPSLPPVLGAVIMAFKLCGMDVDGDILANIRKAAALCEDGGNE